MTTDDHVSMDTRSKDILRIQEPSGWHVVSKCTAFILWINDLHTWFFLSSVLNKSLPSWKRLCIVSSSMENLMIFTSLQICCFLFGYEINYICMK